MKSGLILKRIAFASIPNHTGDMPGTLRAILKQAGIDL